ncbi:glycosyltransferase family 5 protein [Venturia nashicola]|uniref:alpha-1,3-glucan synthase n=1 Tax=Venturia nashicola TaxID=86259 RepID=A0A4Z1P2T4_9PEZI|nr:glycosyltransferase family 5 protein [Venturia nashicola]TLD35807.1 glycosyltransferase family 5 protein [Venturia nashicola]
MFIVIFSSLIASIVSSLKFDPREVDYNLNQNQAATNPLDYSGKWDGHVYHPSPDNWRFPFYTLFLDRFVNGDPTNDNANGTVFEHDPNDTQMRHGGDTAGLVDTLDYIQGMGIKGIYIAGTPFINVPWKSDAYSPLDLSLLDRHFGRINEWREAIDEIHRRGMYVVLDNTMSTMADLIGFEGFLNVSTPFLPQEHKVLYKTNREYHDFKFGNDYKADCTYPRFWNGSGQRVLKGSDPEFDKLGGCYDSEFDQYGDIEGFGSFPDWQRQLSKFASLQDRLREWVPAVRSKIELFSCLAIQMLDADGYRFDKATQITVDALADYSEAVRSCARKLGKENFFMPGEITGSDSLGAIYLGRGREPQMRPKTVDEGIRLNSSSEGVFLRDIGRNGLDGAAFHYSIYRHLTRFLGMDGNISLAYDVPENWVDIWNTMLTTNDFVNANTGEFDPRHMYGVTNQDVFRWPAIQDGTQKMLLGLFITTLHMPGIPKLLWGEEQAFYIFDSTAANYVFGRQAMSSAQAWQSHGCYNMGVSQYFDFPIDAAAKGCRDDSASLDHRDPAHPIRNIIKSMYALRRNYPVLNDGYFLQSLSNQTRQVFLPGSNGIATEVGLWSTVRDFKNGIQNTETGAGTNSSIWLVYHNDGEKVVYKFDCSSNATALFSPYPGGTTVKNLLAPYEEIKLKDGPNKLFLAGSQDFNGCLDNLELEPWAFRAYVPIEQWKGNPSPTLTKFVPGHDARVLAKSNTGNSVDIEFQFSQDMDCDFITENLVVNSTTTETSTAKIDIKSVVCGNITETDPSKFVAQVPSAWSWKATLIDVPAGIHALTIANATSADGFRSTEATDRLMLRVGLADNPMVFPRSANYTQGILAADGKDLVIAHKASGADKWRYSTNWASSWSDWREYDGKNDTVKKLPWSGTKRQEWKGEHVILQYWSKTAGSSDHVQHADLDPKQTPRRFPHIFAHGEFNQFGFDGGLDNVFKLDNGKWDFHLMTEWPSKFQLNIWGINPDKKRDQTFVYGDTDNDTVLDRSNPGFLAENMINVTQYPPSPFIAYKVQINEADFTFKLIPAGSRLVQVLIFSLLWTIPVLTGAISIWAYMGFFYAVKFNSSGVSAVKNKVMSFGFRHKFEKVPDYEAEDMQLTNLGQTTAGAVPIISLNGKKRRTVLIATMEYDIEDWAIKIKIGGLGVMAQLMGKSLTHQDLIWVVPCVGGIDYPVDTPGEPMVVTILGEPMDDLDSAVYYSAWNACIAETTKRFPIDIYHINDYHGSAAPLYLLPETIPVCLSLHNAEFQGLWPMRDPKESDEVAKVYNLSPEIIQKYVQFGEVFNLLHAAASYLRVHQKGFGAVGVSNKYGARSYARYPIFWGLKEIGKLPNPDPSDTAPWNKETEELLAKVITVDPAYEASRGDLRRQAQEWASLDVDPTAELFVFVGRWSNQKGVDLIADVFPAVLEKHSKVQLIAIGPVIDLYGKFAALKLDIMMKKYPGRVYSKPEFTALPPFIFTGAEFALIPSRDEPFGLVAVEFGRKGALGVGARVGGLGQMPGWWFTVESTTTSHMQRQFKSAIEEALESKTADRALMRAKSAKQRFPVAKWVEDLGILQDTAIRVHEEEKGGHHSRNRAFSSHRISGQSGGDRNSLSNPASTQADDFLAGGLRENPVTGLSTGLNRSLSLGVRTGPGHRSRLVGEDSSLPQIMEMPDRPRSEVIADEYFLSRDQAEQMWRTDQRQESLRALEGGNDNSSLRGEPDEAHRSRSRGRSMSPAAGIRYSRSPDDRDRSNSPAAGDSLLMVGSRTHRRNQSSGSYKRSSVLDLSQVTLGRKDFKLQNVDATFNDTTGEYYKAFEEKLSALDGKTSEKDLCIEEYLVASEKAWFARYRAAKLGRRSRDTSPMPVRHASPRLSGERSRPVSSAHGLAPSSDGDSASVGDASSLADEFLLGADYSRPSILKRWLQTRIGDWPIYSLLLALGQIMAANSYQITLLSGDQGQTPEKLYIIGGIFMITSCLWWIVFRTLKSMYVLSLPFVFYGLAFVFLGMAPFLSMGSGRDWMRNIATALYTTASSSGSLFFAMNFGDEGGSPIKSWVLRACIIQGTQQIYITALFYWGNTMTVATSSGQLQKNLITDSPKMAAVTLPIAVLMFAIAVILFTSLPPYYRQTPGKIPNFYRTLIHRKLIPWFFITVILQNYFLSSPYGRNWAYLWSSKHAPVYAVTLLVLFFFVVIWSLFLFLFGKISHTHSWALPIFAIGLGAPRWAQMLWATSGIGAWVPWMPGGPVAGALAGRSLWLWLGVCDAIQGVGFGMMLLQTLTRIHIAVSLMAAQLIGTAITLLAKATSPDRDGPGDVFPDFSKGVVEGLSKPWFWIALACQLVIPIGFFKFFRKEQLSKP